MVQQELSCIFMQNRFLFFGALQAAESQCTVPAGLQPPKDSSGAPSLQVVPPEALGEYAVVQSKPHEYTSTV